MGTERRTAAQQPLTLSATTKNREDGLTEYDSNSFKQEPVPKVGVWGWVGRPFFEERTTSTGSR